MSWTPGPEVTAWLVGLGLDVAEPVRYDRMAGGRSNMLFLVTDADGWTLRSADGSRAAHVEHTVAVTADGPRILTAPR